MAMEREREKERGGRGGEGLLRESIKQHSGVV